MALTSAENVSMWGLARLVGSRIMEYEEKPVAPKTKSHLVNAWIYVMEPGIFSFIKRDAVKLESEVFPRLAEESRLVGYPFEGQWMDITAPNEKASVSIWSFCRYTIWQIFVSAKPRNGSKRTFT